MGHRARLPGTETDDRIVCHVDMDCFYAACERLREPALRGEPVVVGMGYEPGETLGAVATASYEARAYGVESAQAISEALELLPRKVDAAKRDGADPENAGFYRPVDMSFYESVGGDVKAALREHADVLREVSIDEAYLDVTGQTTWDGVAAFARRLKRTIDRDVGVTASVGVAPTMSAAKVASDHDKPDGLVVVEPGEVESFFAPLAVDEVHGVGPVTAARLREMGVETAGDLASADITRIESEFGQRGRQFVRVARGVDNRPVEPTGNPKSLSRESAFSDPTTDAQRQYDRLETLAAAVAKRASRRDILYQTISIKVVTPPFDVNTRADSLSGPVADAALVTAVARDLFEEFEGQQIRKLGVRVANLSFTESEQPTLDRWEGATEGGVDGGESPEGGDDSNKAPDEISGSDTGSLSETQRTLTEFE
jgi:DNA polymerase IV (DinB-like DNA polymerase)